MTTHVEARCDECGETFIPNDPETVAIGADGVVRHDHYVRDDGVECGGSGPIVGEWVIHEPPAEHYEGALAVTRRMLDDWIPDPERRGWWHMGSGMDGPGEPMTESEHEWITHVESASPKGGPS